MKSEIKQVNVKALHHNPYRLMSEYPMIEKKLATLQHSMEDVGCWEGIIAREAEAGYELAFGHHRLEAAKRAGLKTVPVIVRKLSDEDMLKFMGRENGEDYRTEFLIMLNTWEAANGFFGDEQKKSVDIARVLGWTSQQESGRYTNDVMNGTAIACSSAHALITGGYMKRNDLKDLSVSDAKAICSRAQSRIEQLDKMAKKTRRPEKEVEAAKKHIGKGAKLTADKSRKGTVASKDLRGQVDADAFGVAAKSVKASPLFEAFAKNLSNSIENMLNTDVHAEKLAEMVKALNSIQMDEDLAAIKRVDFVLGELADRATSWQKKLVTGKVTNLKRVK